MNTVTFRDATSADATALGALHVASWRETYAGLLPARLLDDLSAEARSAMWSAVLTAPATPAGTAVLVAESGGAFVGFGACGGQRDEALAAQDFDGEIGAIYVLRLYQHGGVGRSLMNLMARNLMARGWTAATLWVLRDNSPARSFYDRLGGALVGDRETEQSGVPLAEVAYGWTDLSSLIR